MRYLVRHLQNNDYYKAWSQFASSGTLPDRVNPSIGASWRRCSEKELDPRGNNVPGPVQPQVLDALRTRNAPLLEASRCSLDVLEASLGRMPYVVLLSDSKGDILVQLGSDHVGKYFEQVGFVAGGSCCETIVGTTAIGLVLVEQKPITVVCEEHYSQMYHWLCCAASPIFDAGGHLAGGLNIVISHEHASNVPLLLGLSLSTVRCIQSELHTVQFLSKMNETRGLTDSMMNYMEHGVIIFDRTGNIVHANRKASNLLNTPVQQLVSRNYHQFIESEILPISHSSGAKVEGKATLLHCREGRSRCSLKVNPLHDHSGQLLGSMAVLEDDRKQWAIRREGASAAVFSIQDVAGESAGMKRAVALAQRFALSDVPILLYGETGTGKELFAQAIHNLSYRGNGPFVPLNCAAIPGGLVESELFGYVRGAFTGAAREGKKGKFEIASGGTLFLDEIDSMPADLQAKLLRVLESNEIVPLGDHNYRSVDVRLIAAMGGASEGVKLDTRLRKDLFYRLSSVRIFLPPLRTRLEDIDLLAHIFLKQSARKHNKAILRIDPDAMSVLKSHDWPGNVRELKSSIEFAVCIAESDSLRPDDLPDHIRGRAPELMSSAACGTGALGDMEKSVIERVLEENKGSRTLAAKAMGLSRTTFYRKCKKHNLVSRLKPE